MTLAQVRAHLEKNNPEFLERRPSDYNTPEWDMDPEDWRFCDANDGSNTEEKRL